MAATVEAAGGAEARRPAVVYVLDHLVWGILAAILLVCSVTIEHFFQIGIFINIAQHATFVGLLAIGLSFCIIAGHMDLSIESVMAFAAMLAAWLTASRGSPLGIQLNTWLTLLIALGFGALVGLVNAVLVVRFRINAFIVTLATYISVRGLGLILPEEGERAREAEHETGDDRPRHALAGVLVHEHEAERGGHDRARHVVRAEDADGV